MSLQPLLFDEEVPAVAPCPPAAEWLALAARLQDRFEGRLYLGTSSWHFPGWTGWVWRDRLAESTLSRHGLAAYAQHPLLTTVSLDRAFYRLLGAGDYSRLAAQVPASFRFVVKAPALLTDALRRDAETGRALDLNPLFLSPGQAADIAQALAAGLGDRLGALVLQLSPLPARWLRQPAELQGRLALALDIFRAALPAGALLSVEPRDAALLTSEWVALLRHHGARPVLGLHDRMPAAEEQLPMLRAAWPGDLICRWNLQRGQRYAQARDRWAPFDRLQAPDTATRATLVRVLQGTLDAGHRAFLTINNKAEGCAPASVLELARALAEGP